MTSEPDTTIRSMTDRPDVDTLAATVREARGALIETCWTPDEVAEFDAALSDLAARAREERRWYEHFHTEMQRADAAEADRDSARQANKELAHERDVAIDCLSGAQTALASEHKRAETAEAKADRLARRVAELEDALGVACDLLAGEGYDTDPDYTQEWATVSGPLAGDGGDA